MIIYKTEILILIKRWGNINQRIFGYARVSSANQNLDRQLIELERYVPRENIVVDKESKKDLHRGGYQALKNLWG